MNPGIGNEKFFTSESELAGLVDGIHLPLFPRSSSRQPAQLQRSNRFIYRFLTAVLAVVYLGSVITLQDLFRQEIGPSGKSHAAVVISTLCAAALCSPLRRWIQKNIDRRFFRRNYDVKLTLQAFSAALHNEVDLEQLSRRLVNLVEETIQPSSVSLWLNEPKS